MQLNRSLFRDAERAYSFRGSEDPFKASISKEVGKIREQIRSKLNEADSGDQGESIQVGELVDRLSRVELENKQLRTLVEQLEKRLSALDGKAPSAAPAAKPAAAPAAAKPAKKDDDFDLFDDDEEEDDEEKKHITEERLKAYAAKKTNSESQAFKLSSSLSYSET